MRLDLRSTMTAAALLGAALTLGGTSAFAASDEGSASGQSVTAIAISGGDTTNGLNFGKFSTPYTSGTATITINPQTGAASKTGSIVLRSNTGARAAEFTVTGEANATYAITLPSDGAVSLSEAGGDTIPLSSFTAYSTTANATGTTGTLNGSGSDTLKVGATATVEHDDNDATYSGTFTVAVEYN